VVLAGVKLENLCKVFEGEVTAVDKANLEVRDGEFMVIVGPSGCGKTTCLRMIAGLEEPTSGDIHIGDRCVTNVSPKDRDIAMVFQNYALYPHMTVFANMAFGLKLRKMPKDQIQTLVEAKAKLLGIGELLKRKPKALSGGQRQRVALGRALVRDPRVFLYDEPLSNLDAKLRVSTRAELKALHYKMKTTSIYVTHDQAEAMTLGDRICVMYLGEIQQVAPPMEIYEQPVNRFVAGFLGTPSMNFFSGTVCKPDGESGELKFQFEDQSITLPAEASAALADYIDKQVTLGVRPEHLSPHSIDNQTDNLISARLIVVEPLGDKTEMHFNVGNKEDATVRFVACLDPHESLEVGSTVDMHINLEKIHLFEPGQTGNVIYSAGQPAVPAST